MTLEAYLRQAIAAGATDFRLRAFATGGPGLPTATDGGSVTTFYIHPLGKDGITVNFAVQGDHTESLGASK